MPEASKKNGATFGGNARRPETPGDSTSLAEDESGLTSMLRLIRRHLPSRMDGSKAFDAAAILLLLGLVALALLDLRAATRSRNDEEVQHRYGELILSYYASGFTDQARLPLKNLYLYGGLFDVMAVLLGRVLPFDLFDIRHVLCAADRRRRHRRDLGDRAADRRLARRLHRGDRARHLRRVVWRDVQSHQGHPVRRRHDGRDLLPDAHRPRPAASAPAARRSASRSCSARRSACARRRTPADRLCRRGRARATRRSRRACRQRDAFLAALGVRARAGARRQLPDHDRGVALGRARARSIRCAHSAISRNSTTDPHVCCSATSIRWPTCRAGTCRPICDQADRCRFCSASRSALVFAAWPTATRSTTAIADGWRSRCIAFTAAVPGRLPRDRSRACVHRHAAFPLRRAAAGGARRHRLRCAA